MKFAYIPQFPQAYYTVHVGLDYLPDCLEQWDRPETPLILNPEWQRGHVWTEQQKISYMEYFLKGGTTGSDIYFNCSSWQGRYNTPVYCVDGLQRITAALDFVKNKLKVFGCYRSEYEDRLRSLSHGKFTFHMLCIKKKKDLLKVYVDFNSGGTPHNPEEIIKVEKMIAECDEKETL